MKRLTQLILALVTMLVMISCGGPEQAAPGTPDAAVVSAAPAPLAAPENAEETIAQLEREWVAAIVKGDTATLEGLLAADFVGTTDDQIYGKADAIEDVRTGTHESLELDSIQVRLFGDTAVVTMGQTETSHHGNEDMSGRYLFTDVWAKQGGRWLAVASHGSRAR
jgi:ketosteroid isomerase-like protein